MSPDKSFHGEGGMLSFSELIGESYGKRYGQYEVFEPTIEDVMMRAIKRETQIVFPKDGFYICFKLSVKSGSKVLEVGTGSGALTFLFSHAVGPEGRVISFEKEERHYKNAKRNIERFAPWDNVDLRHEDIMDQTDGEFNAAFVDVREPWLLTDKVGSLLTESASLGMIVPTANQVSDILKELHNGFGDIEVLEIMLRKYKTVSERVRPEDRMIAHTGYLVFARKLS